MSNLSQFFALGGGNKIKKIQTVTAAQQSGSWNGVTASISSVDTSKTLLICSPSNNSLMYFDIINQNTSFQEIANGSISNIGHGAYLSSNNQVSFYGNDVPTAPGATILYSSIAKMVVQVVEFE